MKLTKEELNDLYSILYYAKIQRCSELLDLVAETQSNSVLTTKEKIDINLEWQRVIQILKEKIEREQA